MRDYTFEELVLFCPTIGDLIKLEGGKTKDDSRNN